MKSQLGRVSSSLFLQNVLIETSSNCFEKFLICYLVLCHFLISWSLEDSKHIKKEEYVFWRPVYSLIANEDGHNLWSL